MTDPRATDAAARVRERAPELAGEPVEQLVHDYLDAAEPHDLATLTADDVAGAVIAILRLGRDRPRGGRVVMVANPTHGPRRLGVPAHRRSMSSRDDAPVPRRQRQPALVRRGYDIHLLLHPLLDVPRSASTSHLHVEIDRETDPAVLDALAWRDRAVRRRRVRGGRRLGRDARPVRRARRTGCARHRRPASIPATSAEVATYLEWLADDHFTFVGASASRASRGHRARSELRGRAPAARCSSRARPPMRPPTIGLLTLTQARERSTVHRAVPLDYVGVKRFDGRRHRGR